MKSDLNLEKGCLKNISRITAEDRTLFDTYIVKSSTGQQEINYENSFEYIRMYFNFGKRQGYKYYDGDTLIFFARVGSKQKSHFKIFKPLSNNIKESIDKLSTLIKILKKDTLYPITIVCLTRDHLKNIKPRLKIQKIRSFDYFIYDLNELSDLKGIKWKNVRQKVNAFIKNNPNIKITQLNEANSKKILHFIPAWRKGAIISRGFSYADIEKNKFAVRFYSNKVDLNNIWAKVYYIQGRVEGFQLLYRLIQTQTHKACAHAIGLANHKIIGLSEYSQIDIWQDVKKDGIRYINDGPSWRPGLKKYKQKFNPCGTQQVYECSV